MQEQTFRGDQLTWLTWDGGIVWDVGFLVIKLRQYQLIWDSWLPQTSQEATEKLEAKKRKKSSVMFVNFSVFG